MSQEDIKFPHLYLVDWPFQINPSPLFYKIWGDRKDVYQQIVKLINRVKRRNTSSILLIWGWFGAGKSHTLRHIEYITKEKEKNIIATYDELPKSCSNFLDFYRSFSRKLDLSIISDIYFDVLKKLGEDNFISNVCPNYTDFYNGLNSLFSGHREQKTLAKAWFHSDKVNIRSIGKYGINKKIDDEDTAINVIESIVKLISYSSNHTHIIWMLDEFQRISDIKINIRKKILNSLQSAFDHSPEGLTIILSFSVMNADNMIAMLTQSLRNRINRPPISIPEMNKEEAIEFARDLINVFRPNNFPPSLGEFFPFNQDAIIAVIDLILESDGLFLNPREIMKKLDIILNEEEDQELIKNDRIKEIDKELALEILKKYGDQP